MTAPAAQAQPGMVPGTRNHYYVPANDKTVHWGYFSKLPEAARRGRIRATSSPSRRSRTTPTTTPERMVKGDPGAESVFYWDKTAQGREPARRRADGRLALRARRGRRPRRAHLHRPGRREGRRARRHPRGAHPRREAAPVREPRVQGQELRQQRRRVVGLPLQRPARRSPSRARSSRSTRSTPTGERNWAKARLQLPLDAADRSVRRRAQDHRLPGRAGRPQHGEGELRRAEERARADPPALRRDGPGAGRGRHGRFHPAQLHRRQHRQLAHRQGRHDVLPGRGAGRAALGGRLRTPRRATPSCAARPSSARSPAPSS